jgi:ABC-2 type transport system ATP-binding protein
VLLTTHSLPVAEAVAHRIAVLDRGQILAEGTLEDLQNRTNEARSGVEGNTLERIFFKLVEEEALERERAKAAA